MYAIRVTAGLVIIVLAVASVFIGEIPALGGGKAGDSEIPWADISDNPFGFWFFWLFYMFLGAGILSARNG